MSRTTTTSPSPADVATRIDCHVHVFDPERFPYAPDAWYVPTPAETGTPAQLDRVLDAHGVRHALLVGPNSGYGTDNRLLLDTLARGRGRCKGIAVLRNDAGRDELQELKARGVIGVAFNAALLGVDGYRDIGPLLARLRDLDLWADVQVEGDQLVALAPMLDDSGVRMVFDHCGRPVPANGVGQAGFATLLGLARTGRAAVKLSGLAKVSTLAPPHDDVRPYLDALIEAFTPRQLVWASDWPFLRAPARIDYGPLLGALDRLLPDAGARHAVLWETPCRLFGFGDAGV
jgi:predicted TIM-barrel fold metal-dependent hydrolase